MVLSLPFILAIVGAGAGLLVGILIFGEVSEAIECPASGSGGGGTLIDTLTETSDGTFDLGGAGLGEWGGQLIATSGQQVSSVTVNNMENANIIANITSEIWIDATTDIDSSTLVATSDNTLDVSGFTTGINFTWTFTPSVTVNNPNTFIALHIANWDSSFFIPSSSVDVGSGIIQAHDTNITSGFYTPLGIADILMRVETTGGGGSPAETGSEQCEQAKDTAWTVIGIMPVALFFGLFALFSSVMPRPT